RLWIALLVWLTVSFSNPVMSYSFLLFTELTTGLLLIYAFRRLALGWGSNGPLRLLLVGICIGYIPWLAWRCVPIAAGLSLYAVIQWWRYRRSKRAAGDTLRAAPATEVSGNGGSDAGAAPVMPTPTPIVARNNGSVLWAVWLLLP